jgi:hypothetical protein
VLLEIDMDVMVIIVYDYAAGARAKITLGNQYSMAL